MGCRILLIRHGETVWNSEMKLQGHADIPLSEKGVGQAKALAGRLFSLEISAVYCSDLQRAMETARFIAAPRGLDLISVRSLREIDFGQWEGHTFKEIREKYGDLAKQWWTNPVNVTIPGGESLTGLVSRVAPAIKGMLERHDGQQVAVVCHGGPIRSLVCTVLDMDLNKYWKIRQDNAALNIIDFSDWNSGVVALLNDRSHLPEDFGVPYRSL
ncbi:MAG: alpha-ribazole phosphatase [Bacillota bacterium]